MSKDKGHEMPACPELPYCPVPYLSGDHDVFEAAHSPAQCSMLLHWQLKYSADTIIQTVANVFRDCKYILCATSVIAHSFLACIYADPGDLEVWLLHMLHG